jgi:hypothetical protein
MTSKDIDQENGQSQVRYFAISTRKLYVLSVLTFWLYEFYWFYRNWKAVKAAEQSKIHPIWRALLAIFYAKSLFEKIESAAMDTGYSKIYLARQLASFYVVSIFLNQYLARVPDSFWATVASFGLVFATPLIFIPIQKMINHIVGEVDDGIRPKSKGEWAVVGVGLVIFVLTMLAYFPSAFDVLNPRLREANSLKQQMESLKSQYDICSGDLEFRAGVIDKNDPSQVDKYDADLKLCEEIRQEHNQAVDKYNSLIAK